VQRFEVKQNTAMFAKVWQLCLVEYAFVRSSVHYFYIASPVKSSCGYSITSWSQIRHRVTLRTYLPNAAFP
jgi:hypothetical protein